jgi:hypothetical protein
MGARWGTYFQKITTKEMNKLELMNLEEELIRLRGWVECNYVMKCKTMTLLNS